MRYWSRNTSTHYLKFFGDLEVLLPLTAADFFEGLEILLLSTANFLAIKKYFYILPPKNFHWTRWLYNTQPKYPIIDNGHPAQVRQNIIFRVLSTERAWNKEGVAWSQKWLPYHLPEGYLGVTGVQGQRQNESNWTLGNSPRHWHRARVYINIRHALNSNI